MRFRFPASEPRDHVRADWPFYLDRRQRALLKALHDAWGDDAIVQIYAGCVRIRAASGDWRFANDAELKAGLETCSRLRRPADE
ncbi:hypothetical protein KDW69_21125 [Burkholderia ambifaria]|uniref:hypothetical protein n=1 Tax=Burkholderia ambifaria TaxID=152480 RepID=UPI001B98E561|nr:hypothetical protein [Burkholderia ambifaria]MBR8334160.1 hypothetical protein [Burkholderia ambifaria]